MAKNIELWEKEYKIRRTCMLIITHQCNLNCSYCYEDYKSKLQMDFDTAIGLIKKEIKRVKRSNNVHELEIDLMGGEPMMNFSLIKRLVEWAENDNIGVPYIFAMTTNGTLFGENEKRWFKEHRDSIVCCCSYDGNSAMQEVNRGKNSNSIDLDFFSKTWDFQSFHMTVSHETLHSLADGVLNAQKKGYSVEVSLAEGVDWTENDAFIYKRELEKLADFYLKNPQHKPINILLRGVNVVDPSKDRKKIKKYCGTGTYMTAYEPNGSAYGCHMFSPVVLGNKAKKIKDIKFKCDSIANDIVCEKCILKHFCPTCAGFNYKYRGNFGERDKRKCALHLEEATVSAKFQLKLIVQRKNKLSLEDAQHAELALKAINIIEKVINKDKHPYYL